MQHFPREHMIIATVVAFLTAIPALLWPTEPNAAGRSSAIVIHPPVVTAQLEDPAPIHSDSRLSGASQLAGLQAPSAGPEQEPPTATDTAPSWEMPVAKMMGVEITSPATPTHHDSGGVQKTESSSQSSDQTEPTILRAADLGLKPHLKPGKPGQKPVTTKETQRKTVSSKAIANRTVKPRVADSQPDFFADVTSGSRQAASDARLTALKLNLPETKASAIPVKLESWEQHTVRKGDSLWKIFDRMSLNRTALSEVMQSGKIARTLNRIRPGDQLELIRTQDGSVEKLRYMRNRLEGVVVSRTSGRLKAEKLLKVAEVIPTYAAGNITDSLFVDAKKAGLDDAVIMQLVSVFGWDIDFAQDIRRGDSFGILYEQMVLDGEPVGVGKILAAHFSNRNRTFNAVHYTDSSGHSGYFTPDGRSMRKAFLRTPVDFARVSSHFNLRRKHPVLHTIRAHKGVDYAAARGTPIRASGDGKIIHKGRKGGYGRTIMIEHGQGYKTLYAHLNGYKRGLKNGAKVRQGDIIGYVGSSGLATGPHLHYEFHVNGRHKNPLTVKLPKAKPIPERERRKFLAHATEMTSQLAALRTTRRVAMRDPAK